MVEINDAFFKELGDSCYNWKSQTENVKSLYVGRKNQAESDIGIKN